MNTSTRVGYAGFGVLALAFGLSIVNYANDVHCPGCDRLSLTDAQFAFWEKYFVVKDVTYGVAALLLLVAIPFASPRRWPFVAGLLIAGFAFALTPM